MKIVPVTCLYAGKPELPDKVTQAIKVHQNNDTAVAFGLAAARILEHVLLGTPLLQALDQCQDALRSATESTKPHQDEVGKAFARGKAAASEYATLDELLLELSHEKMKDTPESSFYNLAARSCALPGAFTGPIYLLYKAAAAAAASCAADETGGNSAYLTAIRENILASGDTCSRAVFIGAVLAAAYSETSPLSQDLIDKVDPTTYEKIDAAAHAIADSITV